MKSPFTLIRRAIGKLRIRGFEQQVRSKSVENTTIGRIIEAALKKYGWSCEFGSEEGKIKIKISKKQGGNYAVRI